MADDAGVPLRRIVVAGGGAGWMAAVPLVTLLTDFALTLVGSATIGTVGVG